MNKRWYDSDPTLSMAVSLLQNAPKSHQEMVSRYMMRYLQREGIMDQHGLDPERLSFMFPLVRRISLDTKARELLEVMKRLPHGVQIEMALNMINYIYLLDSGLCNDGLEDEPGQDLTVNHTPVAYADDPRH